MNLGKIAVLAIVVFTIGTYSLYVQLREANNNIKQLTRTVNSL